MTNANQSAFVQRKVICPHCWEEFYNSQALFVSMHDTLRGDDVLNNPDAPKRFGPQEVRPDNKGIIRDPMGLPMTERACPRCHLHIPGELLLSRPRFFSIAGSGSSGKTYFLTSMLHHLTMQMAKHFKFTMSACDSPDANDMGTFNKILFQGKRDDEVSLPKTAINHFTSTVRMNGMDVDLPKPFIFRLQPAYDHPLMLAGNNNIPGYNFVFYDNAGEMFYRQNNAIRNLSNQTTRHLAFSNGIMFSFDFLQDAAVREQVRDRIVSSAGEGVTMDPQLDDEITQDHNQTDMLVNLVQQVRSFRNMDPRARINVPLVVCVQKFDVWRSMLPAWASIDDSSIEWFEREGMSALHVEEINHISLMIRQLLMDLYPQFVQIAEQTFSSVRYFAVSALGVSPKKSSDPSRYELVIRRGDINPVRVTDPILWLMFKWGMIKKASSNRRNGPAVEVVAKTEDRLTFRFPSRKIFTLDYEYCGCNLIDPVSGQPCHIPKIERPANPQPAPPAVTAPTQPVATPAPVVESPQPKPPQPEPLPEIPQSEIPKAPQKRKKSWFGFGGGSKDG